MRIEYLHKPMSDRSSDSMRSGLDVVVMRRNRQARVHDDEAPTPRLLVSLVTIQRFSAIERQDAFNSAGKSPKSVYAD